MTTVKNRRFRGLAECACLTMALFLTACGGSGVTKQGASQAVPEPRRQSTDTVDPAKIERCGGFTAEAAARILGVTAGDIQGSSQLTYETLRICSFQSRTQPKKIVSFSLGWEKSAGEAQANMTSTRENLGLAKRSIGPVTGSTDKGPALQEISGLGDEAYYTSVNDSLMVRVSNVTIQVMNAPDLEAYKTVAGEVIKGLR